MISFLAEAVFISLSGELAPGPLSASTIAYGNRSPHAGAVVAMGSWHRRISLDGDPRIRLRNDGRLRRGVTLSVTHGGAGAALDECRHGPSG